MISCIQCRHTGSQNKNFWFDFPSSMSACMMNSLLLGVNPMHGRITAKLIACIVGFLYNLYSSATSFFKYRNYRTFSECETITFRHLYNY